VTRAVSVRVIGRVQGVFFRQSTVDEARERGIYGWVRNCPDGSVEAFVQGEEKALQAMLAWLKHGPPAARVDAIDVRDAAVDDTLTGFAVRY
jgi:acylphosphatase